MYNTPYQVPLKEYEGMMADREYWDDLGAEWIHSTLEQKLVRLAGFVQQGGNLKKSSTIMPRITTSNITVESSTVCYTIS